MLNIDADNAVQFGTYVAEILPKLANNKRHRLIVYF